MRDPVRLRDDPAAAADLRRLLGHVPRTKSLDPVTRRRVGRRLTHLLSLPLALTLGLTMKTAAASLAIATGTIAVGAVVVHEVRVLRALSIPLPGTANAPALTRPGAPRSHSSAMAQRDGVDERQLDPTSAVAAFPNDDAAPPQAVLRTSELPRASSRSAFPNPNADASAKAEPVGRGGLEQEAAMLETARRALASSPSDALAIVEEHRARFPQATLALEREMIRLDALYRLGRYAEARRSAESMRQRGGLYAERIERFIEKLERTLH